MKGIKYFAAATVLALTSFASVAAEPVSQQQAQSLTEVGVVSAGGVTTLSSLEAKLAAKAEAKALAATALSPPVATTCCTATRSSINKFEPPLDYLNGRCIRRPSPTTQQPTCFILVPTCGRHSVPIAATSDEPDPPLSGVPQLRYRNRPGGYRQFKSPECPYAPINIGHRLIDQE